MATNVLFITLDQFRGDALSCAGHPVVRTPNLDALAADGVRFARHYSQAAPCSPGRAALYTGTYQMNNRVVANGTPLDDRFDNIARIARRAGYNPTLFGYSDQGVDPRLIDDPNDPRLSTYEEVLPGFTVEVLVPEHGRPWLEWLASNGHDLADNATALTTEPSRHESLSQSTFLTNRFVDWLDRQDGGWFAHLSYLRPHPPYSAAGRFATMYSPDDGPSAIPAAPDQHRAGLHNVLLSMPAAAAPIDPAKLRKMRAQYWGMVSEVDEQLARLWQAVRDRGEWDDTIIVVTADHGEQLGDQGLRGKLGFFESSFHILGIMRAPGRAACRSRARAPRSRRRPTSPPRRAHVRAAASR